MKMNSRLWDGAAAGRSRPLLAASAVHGGAFLGGLRPTDTAVSGLLDHIRQSSGTLLHCPRNDWRRPASPGLVPRRCSGCRSPAGGPAACKVGVGTRAPIGDTHRRQQAGGGTRRRRQPLCSRVRRHQPALWGLWAAAHLHLGAAHHCFAAPHAGRPPHPGWRPPLKMAVPFDGDGMHAVDPSQLPGDVLVRGGVWQQHICRVDCVPPCAYSELLYRIGRRVVAARCSSWIALKVSLLRSRLPHVPVRSTRSSSLPLCRGPLVRAAAAAPLAAAACAAVGLNGLRRARR